MSITKQCFSEGNNESNEKQNLIDNLEQNRGGDSPPRGKKSRAKYLKDWRKKNPDKVKVHRSKADSNYYRKNSKKYLDRAKTNYHEYNITHAFPAVRYCRNCDEEDVLADHDCFPQWWPHNIWRHGRDSPDEEQIRKNIKFVINLQRKGKILTFLLYPPQVYLNRKKYSEEHSKKIHEFYSKFGGVPEEHDAKKEWSDKLQKEWKDFDREMQECFSKTSTNLIQEQFPL